MNITSFQGLKRRLLIIALLIIILVGTIASALADDDQLLILASGDDQLLILWTPGSADSTTAASTPAPSSSYSGSYHPKYYDVISRVYKDTYTTDDKVVQAVVDITYMGLYTPQQDGILQYELISPSGKIYPWKLAKIKEGTHEGEQLTYNLPDDPEVGQWQFVTTWIVQDLEPMRTIDVFNVKHPFNWTLVLYGTIIGILGATLATLLIKRRNSQ